MRMLRLQSLAVIVLASMAPAFAQETVPFGPAAKVDAAVAAVLASSGVPGASIAVVQEGRIVYERAYGLGRLSPKKPATSAMRYSIGSVSKQFTATAILLLAQEGRLSLDDKVSRWLPDLTRAGEVTVRQLLSMTAGYQDYWPQDFVFPAMLDPITPQALLDRWARKPLDFDPGTKWQYSNTNYVIAGEIVERGAGMPLLELLRTRIFTPLGMTSVKDVDAGPLGPEDAGGYLRNALGPLRPAPKEARGWLFAAGELGMTAHDLALWDISVIDQSILQPSSYREMQTDVRLANGVSTGYGLGVNVGIVGGRRRIEHGGAVSGFLTENAIYPDDRAAIVVFCNAYPGGGSAEAEIGDRIREAIFQSEDAASTTATEQAGRIFAELQAGRIDRAVFSPDANAYFTSEVVADFASSLGPLGAPKAFVLASERPRGGMIVRRFRITCGARALVLTTMTLPDGKLEQYIVGPE